MKHNCEKYDGTSCEDCCEHGDMEKGLCLDCGKNRSEELFADAVDRAKDRRKYGEL